MLPFFISIIKSNSIYMYSVYILYSKKSDVYYVGHTENVEKRLNEHNNPIRNSKYTAKHLPWILVLDLSFYLTRSEAMQAEKYIKKQKNRKFIEKLIYFKNDENSIKLILEGSSVG